MKTITKLVLCSVLVFVAVTAIAAFVLPEPVFALDDGSCFSCVQWIDGPGGFYGGWERQVDGGGGGGGGGPITPYCTIYATPNPSPSAGAPVTLTWTTYAAQTASINNGVGSVSPVSAGSVVVYPTVNTTYTMTTTHTTYGGATCQVTVNVPPPPQLGCIQILKETYDTNSLPLFPVAQFTFKLNNATTTTNDANGNATFLNVPAGTHTVTEIVPPTWTMLSVTPANGVVNVTAGQTCAAVVFKNKQVIEPGECKLVITKSVNKNTAALGEEFEYTINFKNEGTADCTGGGVKVVDVVDSRITYLSETHSGNVTGGYDSDPVYKASDRTLRWNGNILTPNESGWVKWKGKVTALEACSETIPNKAKITSKEYDNFHVWVESNTVNVTVTKDCSTPKGCIQIKKETYNTTNQQITPVAQFTFKLDNATTTTNDANGDAVFNNVSIGTHTVSEIVPSTWTMLSVTPVNGTVNVTAGPICAAVVFKNKQVITTPPPVTIKATKIICDSESDLPNRSGGADIASTTAADFLATHPNCRLGLGWKWQFADGDTGNPGDNADLIAAGPAWTTFVDDNTDGVAEATIALSALGDASKIWVREAIPPDYIPFKGIGIDDVSAEMYCSTDVLNYDNYDKINSPEAGKTYHCVAWNVKKPVVHDEPSCLLMTATGNGANNYTLSWSTQNATSFIINQGIGSVTPVAAGSVSVSATTTTTYIGTVVGAGGTKTCQATVEFTPPGPFCTLSINKNEIRTGESIKLTWTSGNVTQGFITNYGTTTPVSGATSDDVYPPTDTTYVGTFWGPYGTTTCSASVRVTTGGCQGSCGGGGMNPPNVVLYQKPGETPLVASVFLSQIPYTGFEAGPMLTAVFWLAVALLAAMVAYFTLRRNGFGAFSNQIASFAGVPTEAEIRRTLESHGDLAPLEDAPDAEAEIQPIVASVAIAPAPRMTQTAFVPVQPKAPVKNGTPAEEGIPALEDVLESRAHAAGVLMSPESVALAAELAEDRADTLKIFGEILNDAVRTIPREDGWIMLTSDRLEELAAGKAEKAPEKHIVSTETPTYVLNTAKAAPETPADAAPLSRIDEASASAFVGAVLSGNREQAFGIIRSMEHDGVNPTTLMTSAATVLDRLYRVRQGGQNGIDAALLAASQNVANDSLHRMVEIFTHALDTVYSNPFTGIKLALAQAFDIVG